MLAPKAIIVTKEMKKRYKEITSSTRLIEACELLKGTAGDFSYKSIQGTNKTKSPIKISFKDFSKDSKHKNSDAYGTYTVETTAAYLSFAGALHQGTVQTASIDGTDIEASSAQPDAATASELLAQLGMEELAGEDVEVIWMDDNSIFNGGTGAQGSTLSTQATGDSNNGLVSYIDGFRVYNPLTDEQAANAEKAVKAKLSDDVEVTMVSGGQPIYYYLISVE